MTMEISINHSSSAETFKPLKRRVRRLWKRYLKWPAPLWRLRGYALLNLAGYEFKFYVTNENIWFARRANQGKYETAVREFLKGVVQPGDVFFDIGAWIGPYTLLASKLVQPGGSVYAFEPDPVARRLLERHVAANDAFNVTVLPYAVADQDGSAYLESHRLGGAEGRLTQDVGPIEVKTITLQSFCGQQHIYPSIIKIDVEGGEAKVFDGGTEVLQGARAIVLEFHQEHLHEAGVDHRAFFQSLFKLGKRIVFLHQRRGEGEYRGTKPGTELRKDAAVTGVVNIALLQE